MSQKVKMSITVAQKKVHKEFIFISCGGVKNVFKIDDLAFQLHFKCDSVNQFILLNKRSVLFFLKLQNCPSIKLYPKVRKSRNDFFMPKFPPKNERTNEFYFTTMKPQIDLFSFVFWRKLKTPKRHFEIKWPPVL